MRVLQIIEGLARAGAEKQLVQLCLGLRRQGVEVGVCCISRGGPYEAPLRAAGVPLWFVSRRGPFDLPVVGRLGRVIHAFRPQVVHTWLFTANAFGRAAALLCRVPAVVGSERGAEPWKGWRHRATDRLFARLGDAVIANAEAVKRLYVAERGYPAAKVTVIPNGLDLAAFDAAASVEPQPPLPPGEGPVVGCAARLVEQKGLAYLLRAFAALRRADARLWIAGEGPLEAQLHALAGQLRLDADAVFLGPRADVPALLRRTDLFVMPSLWEGMPNVVMEAMAAARAVAATAVDGTVELVADGDTGVLVPPGDVNALSRAMGELLDNPGRRRRLGEAGRARIAAKFSDEAMVRRTLDLYERLLAGHEDAQ